MADTDPEKYFDIMIAAGFPSVSLRYFDDEYIASITRLAARKPRLLRCPNTSPGRYYFSKFLLVPVLLDSAEMKALFAELGDFFIFDVSRVLDDGEISRGEFLSVYAEYVEGLKRGEVITSPWFSSCFTTTEETIETIVVPDGRAMRKACAPVVQLQPHTFTYSTDDGKFRSMVRGEGAISWGIQFSYPQLFEDPKSRDIVKVDGTFPNTPFFRALQRWVRHHTRPTPFEVEGRRINVPIRLGKQCFEWIDQHPQLGHLCVLKS
jgi:hypothetical protein